MSNDTRQALPPLPEPAQESQSEGYMPGCPTLIPATPDFYTAEQMHAYARAALKAVVEENERLYGAHLDILRVHANDNIRPKAFYLSSNAIKLAETAIAKSRELEAEPAPEPSIWNSLKEDEC